MPNPNAEITKFNIGDLYSLKDDYARQNRLAKNGDDDTTGKINFKQGLQIRGKNITPIPAGSDTPATNINFDDTVDWNFASDTLKVNNSIVLTEADLGNGLVGQKYLVNNEIRGEIVGDYTNNQAEGSQSFVTGTCNRGNQPNQLIGGKYNSNKSNTLFEIGNGTGENARSNALEVRSDGTVVCNDIIMNGVNLSTAVTDNIRSSYTNSSAITVTTTDSTILTKTFTDNTPNEINCIGSIPINMATDGNIVITITTNLATKTFKKYCLKGFDILNFIVSLAAGINSLTIKIKSEYVESDLRKDEAKLTSIYNYLMNLGWVAPVVDSTSPQGTIGARDAQIILFGA